MMFISIPVLVAKVPPASHLAVSTSCTSGWSILSRTHVPLQVGRLASTPGSTIQTLVLVLVAGHGPVVVTWLQEDHVDHMLGTIQNITSYDLFSFSKKKLHTHTALIINNSSAKVAVKFTICYSSIDTHSLPATLSIFTHWHFWRIPCPPISPWSLSNYM